MTINSAHWLQQARRCPSPNCDARPDKHDISLLVIHAISLPPGEFGGPWIDALFQNRLAPQEHPLFASIADLRVSAHLLIDRNGKITQYVSFNQRAWHAGVSHWQGRDRCNDFSIGVELEGDDFTPFSDMQYTTLVACVQRIMQSYPQITAQRIVGHADIAPARKTDPGPHFDWSRFRRNLNASGDL